MVKLMSGREVEADLGAITIAEFRALFDPKQLEAEGDATLGKVFGLSSAEVSSLPFPDYRAISKEMFDRARDPETSRPNSPGGSTET
jgi:hypothetical protein